MSPRNQFTLGSLLLVLVGLLVWQALGDVSRGPWTDPTADDSVANDPSDLVGEATAKGPDRVGMDRDGNPFDPHALVTVRGVCVDATSGGTLAGCRVRFEHVLTTGTNRTVHVVETAADGTFALPVPVTTPVFSQIRISAESYCDMHHLILAGRTRVPPDMGRIAIPRRLEVNLAVHNYEGVPHQVSVIAHARSGGPFGIGLKSSGGCQFLPATLRVRTATGSAGEALAPLLLYSGRWEIRCRGRTPAVPKDGLVDIAGSQFVHLVLDGRPVLPKLPPPKILAHARIKVHEILPTRGSLALLQMLGTSYTFDGSSTAQRELYRKAIRNGRYWYCELTKDSDKSVLSRIRQRGYEIRPLRVPAGRSGKRSQDIVIVYYGTSPR